MKSKKPRRRATRSGKTISGLDLDIEASATLAEDYDFNQAVKRGIMVSGGGLNRQILTSAELRWMRLSRAVRGFAERRGMQITAGPGGREGNQRRPVRAPSPMPRITWRDSGFLDQSLGVRDLRYTAVTDDLGRASERLPLPLETLLVDSAGR